MCFAEHWRTKNAAAVTNSKRRRVLGMNRFIFRARRVGSGSVGCMRQVSKCEEVKGVPRLSVFQRKTYNAMSKVSGRGGRDVQSSDRKLSIRNQKEPESLRIRVLCVREPGRQLS